MTEEQAYWIIGIGITSIIIACVTIWQNRKMARERHTLEFVKDYNDEPRVSNAFRFIKAVKRMEWNQKIAEYQKDSNRDIFLFLMNKFENLSIGLQHKIYDDALIKKFFGRDIWVIYDNSQELIRYIRAEEGDAEAFSEFERLAKQVEQKFTRR